MSSQGQKTLETRRRQEDIARAMQASLTDHARCLAKADFENSIQENWNNELKMSFQSIQHKAVKFAQEDNNWQIYIITKDMHGSKNAYKM